MYKLKNYYHHSGLLCRGNIYVQKQGSTRLVSVADLDCADRTDGHLVVCAC